MKPYKLIRLVDGQIQTGQPLYDWLIDDGFPIMDIHIIQNQARPPRPIRPLYTAPRAEWLLYGLAMMKWDVDCRTVAEHNRHEVELRDADIAAFATYLAMSFKIAVYDGTWKVTEDEATTYIQHAQRILDVFTQDNYSEYYEIAFGTTNGIMK